MYAQMCLTGYTSHTFISDRPVLIEKLLIYFEIKFYVELKYFLKSDKNNLGKNINKLYVAAPITSPKQLVFLYKFYHKCRVRFAWAKESQEQDAIIKLSLIRHLL